MPDGGMRERKRDHNISVANEGDDCEADSIIENWPCCPDKNTDSQNCPVGIGDPLGCPPGK